LNNTSGKEFKDAKLKLMAGEVNRVYNFNRSYAKTEDRAYNPLVAYSSPTSEKSFLRLKGRLGNFSL
jgi:hypothetical protein